MADQFSFRSVHLKEVRFFAYHGLYEEEQRTGTQFEINLSVDYPSGDNVNDLQETVDYVQLWKIVQREMSIPRPLLETVVDDICHAIKSQFPYISRILVELWKLGVPVDSFQGKMGITVSKNYTNK